MLQIHQENVSLQLELKHTAGQTASIIEENERSKQGLESVQGLEGAVRQISAERDQAIAEVENLKEMLQWVNNMQESTLYEENEDAKASLAAQGQELESWRQKAQVAEKQRDKLWAQWDELQVPNACIGHVFCMHCVVRGCWAFCAPSSSCGVISPPHFLATGQNAGCRLGGKQGSVECTTGGRDQAQGGPRE